MIEKMKKLTFLVYHREYEDFLHRLQDLGVMHVVTSGIDPQQSETISGYVEQIKGCTSLQQEMKGLLEMSNLKADKIEGDVKKGLELVETLTPRFVRLSELRHREEELKTVLAQQEPWGEFDPVEVREKFQAAGCELQFYVAPAKEYNKQIAGAYPVMAINEIKKNTYFVLVAHDEQETLPATRIKQPEASLSKVKADLVAVTSEL